MAAVYVCRFCEKEYQSRSGLRRHLKSKHGEEGVPALPEAVETAGGDEDTEVTGAGVGPASERSEVAGGGEAGGVGPCSGQAVRGRPVERPALDKPTKAACKALGIDEDDVMAFKVYHDQEPLKVVIIEGPVGQKRVWCDGD